MTSSFVPAALALAVLGGCAVDDPTTASVQDIQGPGKTAAPAEIRGRTGLLSNCMVTKISATYALGSRACGTAVGATVKMVPSDVKSTVPLLARVEEVIIRPGTTVAKCQDRSTCFDSFGLFGDLVVLRLSTDVDTANHIDPLDTPVATLAWRYPGAVSGVQTGQTVQAGPPEKLGVEQVAETIDSALDTDGSFETTNAYPEPADRGGVFTRNGSVVGTLWGTGWDVGDGNWSLYTSVPKHIDWILNRIKFAWAGLPPMTNVVYEGINIDSFYATEKVCQYACEKTASCSAYNYTLATSSCLLTGSAITGWHAQSGRHSALRWGASTGKSANIVGYVRSDGYNSIVHVGTNGSLHELWRNGLTWSSGTINTITPNRPAVIVGGKLSAYRRSDGVNAIVYRSASNRLIEVALGASGWDWADLTNWGGPLLGTNPVGFVRADGVSSVLYGDSLNGLHETWLGTKGWIHRSMSCCVHGDLTPFVRPGGVSGVVFTDGQGRTDQQFKVPGTPFWQFEFSSDDAQEVTNPASFAPPSAGRPYGFISRDGIETIVYRSAANGIIEMRRENGSWKWERLDGTGSTAQSDPVAQVRTDAIDQVVYRDWENDLREITRLPLQRWNLSAQYTIPDLTQDPSVFQRNDGETSLLFGLAGNHIGEASIGADSLGWGWSDLTLASGEAP